MGCVRLSLKPGAVLAALLQLRGCDWDWAPVLDRSHPMELHAYVGPCIAEVKFWDQDSIPASAHMRSSSQRK